MQERQHAQLPRFYIASPSLVAGQGLSVPADAAKHMRSLRLQEGSAVEVVNGRGSVAAASVSMLGKGHARVQARDLVSIYATAPMLCEAMASPCSWTLCCSCCHILPPLRGTLVPSLPLSAFKPMQVQVDAVQQQPWAGPRIVLAVAGATLKGNRSDWLIEKAVELGAFAFVPLLSQRSPELAGAAAHLPQRALACAPSSDERAQAVAQHGLSALLQSAEAAQAADAAAASGRAARWQRVAAAATEQSLRVHAIHLCDAATTADVALLAQHGDAAVLVAAQGGRPVIAAAQECLHPGEHTCVDTSSQGYDAAGTGPLVLAIGPEGDFTQQELAMLTGAGTQLVGLGEQRLRSETAAIAALSATVLSLSK